jgi:hypothetical protein
MSGLKSDFERKSGVRKGLLVAEVMTPTNCLRQRFHREVQRKYQLVMQIEGKRWGSSFEAQLNWARLGWDVLGNTEFGMSPWKFRQFFLSHLPRSPIALHQWPVDIEVALPDRQLIVALIHSYWVRREKGDDGVCRLLEVRLLSEDVLLRSGKRLLVEEVEF